MNTFKAVICVLLWLVALWRLPAAVRRPGQRAVWTAFTLLAVASTIAVPPIALAIDTATGVNDLCVLLKNLIGVGACAAVLDLVFAMARPDLLRRSRYGNAVGSVLAATLLTVFFFQVPRPERVVNFYEAHASSTAATGYCLTFVAYLAVATAFGSWLCLGYGRKSQRSFLRTGLYLLGVGLAIGTLYSLFRTTHLTARLFDLPFPLSEPRTQLLADAIEYVAIFLIIVGNSLAPLGSAVGALRDWRAARVLRPLWADLTAVVPDVVLAARVRRGPRIRLHRTVIEIRDAALVLAPHVTPELRARALAAVRAGGPGGERAEVAAEAWALRGAAVARARGELPSVPTPHGTEPSTRGGGPVLDIAPEVTPGTAPEGAEPPDRLDFEAEVARLRLLAAAYHSPGARAFASAGPAAALRERV
ncbi:MAB_1171c family putative transporter [Streptomyces sp. NPDC097619]|uniref:MAB_1171c family putative transporter n=1 Tax=Streptomyces sp. NPDC097619 TaxID=3157228 RepID=UPI003326278B